MRTRVASSLAIVVAGLIPTILGGPVFAIFMTTLAVAGFREYLGLAGHVNNVVGAASGTIGYGVLIALAAAALWEGGTIILFSIFALAVTLPVVAQLARSTQPGALTAWSLLSSGSLYLGLPLYAAIALREAPGPIGATWLAAMAQNVAFGWHAASRGLAWTLTVILATWVGDSAAYLTGRALGRRKLAPALSPNKTIEGALGGLAGSIAVGGIAFAAFGLGSWWVGVLAGFAIGLAGQVGDLVESFFKRQAGVKDSGDVIPGHGGVLDRIDALLFAFPVGLILAEGFDGLGLITP